MMIRYTPIDYPKIYHSVEDGVDEVALLVEGVLVAPALEESLCRSTYLETIPVDVAPM